MAVEPVHVPGRTTQSNPKLVPERSAAGVGSAYYEEELKKARAKRELEEEEQRLEATRNPQPSEPPFKISGGVNLGTIDLQADRKAAEEKSERERKAMQDRSDQERAAQQAKVEALEKQNAEIKDKLQATEINHLKSELSKQISDLTSKIQAAGTAPQKGFVDQLAEIRAIAKELGLSTPSAPTGNSDLNIQLEMKKYDIQLQREAQAAERQKFVDDRNYQLELRKLDSQQLEIQNRLAVEKEKLATWTSMPKTIGGIIAQAIIDSGKQAAANPAGAVAGAAAAPREPSGFVDAGIGETGEVECINPACKGVVAVGPTSRVAECSLCHTRIEVRRRPSAAPTTAPKEGAPKEVAANPPRGYKPPGGPPVDLVEQAIREERER